MRLIDADALVEKRMDADCRIGFAQIVDVIDILNAPTISPVKHGRWIHYDSQCTDECSACGATWAIYEHCVEMQFKYCPACGAKMDLQEGAT